MNEDSKQDNDLVGCETCKENLEAHERENREAAST